MTEKISGSAAVSSAWHDFKKNWKFIIPAVLATIAVYVVLQLFQSISQDSVILMLISTIVSAIAGIAMTLAWSNISLKIIRHHHVTWNDTKTNIRSWFPYFLAQIIYGLFMLGAAIIILLAVLLYIGSAMNSAIPGMVFGIIIGISGIVLFVWLIIRYMFISLIVIDHGSISSWNIMKESAKLTKGYIGQLFIFGLLLVLINIVGLILLVIGLAVTVPVSKIAKAYVYEKLKAAHHVHEIKD